MKEFADDNLKFNENGRKFSKRIENTVGKGEIASYEQFLLFSQCFEKTCSADTSKQGFVWKRVNSLPNDIILNQSRLKAIVDDKINVIQKVNFDLRRVESIVGKGENAAYQHFLLFPQCLQNFSSYRSLANDKILNQSKLKSIADDKINVIQKVNFDLRRIENIVRKRENAGYQHFLLFPQCFQKLSSCRSLANDRILNQSKLKAIGDDKIM